MDEPFAALDELSREAMRYELLSVWERERPAVVFVTHSVSESVTLADRVLVLSRGPARVLGEVSVRLPRPRTPDLERSPAFRAAEDEIRALLRAA
jgi:NitT/TauT family transport system ATP-binding protein